MQTPFFEQNQQTIYHADCLDIMRQMSDNCIDSIITDPPYALTNRTPDVKRCKDCLRVLGGTDGNPEKCPRCGGILEYQRSKQKRGFMGKLWDGSVPGVEIWQEALRIAKPGAFLCAFGGSRTYHRLVSAIEDAGWEIRDSIAYLHDGSQQLLSFLESLTPDQLEAYLEMHYPNLQMEWVYSQGMVKGLNISKKMDSVAGAERKVVGKHPYANRGTAISLQAVNLSGSPEREQYITAPTTPQAQLWDGWHTGLAPSHEPIVIAMKPKDGTFVNNAEKWKVSGLWVDGCLIGTTKRVPGGISQQKPNANVYGKYGIETGNEHGHNPNKGRWPKNVIHDGSEEVKKVFAKAGVKTSGKVLPRHKSHGWSSEGSHEGYKRKSHTQIGGFETYGDTGFADRFYQVCPPDRFIYQAKASPKERHGANNHPTVKSLALIRHLVRITKTPYGGVVFDPFLGSGTTLLAAYLEGRPGIGVEVNEEYCKIAQARLEHEV